MYLQIVNKKKRIMLLTLCCNTENTRRWINEINKILDFRRYYDTYNEF